MGGVGDVMAQWPDAEVWSAPHQGGWGFQAPPEEAKCLEDGLEFEVDGARLLALYTPGHCGGHFSFWMPEDGVLISGDCVLGQSTAVFSDLPQYVESLERLSELGAKRILPGHGPVVED